MTSEIRRTETGDTVVISVVGTLDIHTAPDFGPQIERCVNERTMSVKIDLAGLDLIDSSGVAALVAMYKRVRAYGGSVAVVHARDQPLAIFKLLRMDKVFLL